MVRRPSQQPGRPDSPLAVGRRLQLLRIAYGRVQGLKHEMRQAEIARLTGISYAVWNNAETGDNRLGLDNAMKIWRRLGVGLDYIYHDDARVLPNALAAEIANLENPRIAARRA